MTMTSLLLTKQGQLLKKESKSYKKGTVLKTVPFYFLNIARLFSLKISV